MTTDLASLGFAVDSSPLARATSDLDSLALSAVRAEQSALGVGRGFESSTAPMQRAATAAGQLSAGFVRATQAANENARAIGLTRHEYINLGYQISDVVASAASGASAFTILAQQGGQIAPILAQAGSRLGEVFGQVGSGVASAASRIGIMGGIVGTTAAAAVAGGLAWRQYAASQEEAERSLLGIGAASGASVAGINRVAAALADAQTLSVGVARSITSTLAAGGKIDVGALGSVGSLTRGTAALFGESNTEAATRMADLFASPSRAAEVYNARLGVLNATQLDFIKGLEMSGQRTAAQDALVTALQPALQRYTDQTWSISKAWQAVTAAIGSATDAVGHFVSREVTGGTLDERLATATRRYFSAQTNGQPASSGDATYEAELRRSGLSEAMIRSLVRPSAPGAAPRTSLATATADLEDLSEQSRRRSQAEFNATRTARQVQASTEVNSVVQALNPGAEKLKEIQRQADALRTKLSILPLDERGDAQRTMEGLSRQAKQLGDDLAAGGQKFADSLRSAQFNLGMVGASSTGRGLSEAQEQYRRDMLDLDRQNLNPVQRMVQERTLEQTRDANLARIRAETTLSAGQSGGAFSRAPGPIQQQILDAVGRFPTVDPSILAGLLEKESNFTWTGPTKERRADGTPKTTAWGRGQITNDAATDIRRIPGMESFDKYNVDTQVMGAAAYLNLRQKWAGGNQIRALDGYGTGPGYGVDVLRRSGQLGDASDRAGALQVDAAKRAAETAGQQLQNTTANYGKNTVALEANQRATEQVNSALAAGRQVTDQWSASIKTYETAAATAAQKDRLVRYGVDTGFDRDQLGRNSGEAAAYARARSVVGDVNSDAAQGVIASEQMVSGFRELKSMAGGALTGFLTDMRQGVGLMSSMSNLTGRLADRFLSIASDRVISGLLGGLMGGGTGAAGAGGSGLIGSIASAIGGGALPKFAEGGITSGPSIAGEIPGRNEAVIPLSNNRYVPVQINQPPANMNMPAPVFQQEVRNYAGVPIQTQEVTDGRGQRKQVMIVGDATAAGLQTPQAQRAMNAPRTVAR